MQERSAEHESEHQAAGQSAGEVPEAQAPEPAQGSSLARRAARQARFDASTLPGPRLMALYFGWALVWLLGWTIYSNSQGYAVVPGLVLSAAFGVVPLVLAVEGIRSLQTQRYWQGLLSLGFSLAFLGIAGSGQLARAMLFPGDVQPLPQRLPEGASRVDYRASDDQPLAGLLIRSDDAQAPTLVYFHGNAESAGRNLDLALSLRDRGCHVFLAEFRGFGGLPGTPTQDGLFLDGEAALEAASRELGVSVDEIVLCGRSLGSGVASAMAGRGRGRKVVLLSPYTSITDIAARLAPRPLAWLAVRDPLNSRSALKSRAGAPILVFHGDLDRVVPYALGKELAAETGAELVTLPGIGHNDLLLAPHGGGILDRWAEFARAP